MAFNSVAFAIFLPVVLLCYYCLRRRAQNVFLLIASYVFYGWWDWRFLCLLLISTVVDYNVGRKLNKTENGRRRRELLLISICTDLGILGFFKYFNFFADSTTALLSSFGLDADAPTLRIVLPVGISFYTFQALSYTIDIYRRQVTPARNFFNFALYLSFFPQLVAGPIERAQRLLPQIEKKRRVSVDQLRSGCLLILIGLFRKVGIADAISPSVDLVFQSPENFSGAELAAALYLFSFQIYCDFSGYSDIARGCARLLGVELMENFNQPYLSTNITEFWRRWHISLSTWLRDYLYIPLGGNRKGLFNTYRNLMLTMLLGGLWHGANWTFVVWGGMHGVYLSVHKLWLRGQRPAERHSTSTYWQLLLFVMKLFLTFQLVALTWLFFRSAEFSTAWEYLSSLILWEHHPDSTGLYWTKVVVYGTAMLGLDLIQYLGRSHTTILSWSWGIRGFLYGAMVIWMLTLGGIDVEVPFIYFQF